MPTYYVEVYSDGDDNEVIEVPYVKPKPPMITLSASEDEDETVDSGQFLMTNAKTISKKWHRSKKEKRVQNVSESSDHSMSKKNDTNHNSVKTSKKPRSSRRLRNKDGDTLSVQSNFADKGHHSTSSISMSLSTDKRDIETTAELSQNVEPGVELKSNSDNVDKDNVGTNLTTRSSEIVTHSGGSVNDSHGRTDDETSNEFVPRIHISTDIFDAPFTASPANNFSLNITDDNIANATQRLSPGGTEPPGVQEPGINEKGRKRTHSSPGNSGNSRKKSSANSAQEQSRSDLLKFMQHLGLPLQELPALDTPNRKRPAARKAKTPSQETPLPEDKVQETKRKRPTANSKNTLEPEQQKSSPTSTQLAKKSDTRKRLRNPLCESRGKDSPKESPNAMSLKALSGMSNTEIETLKIYPKKWTIAMKKYYGTIKRLENDTCDHVQSKQSNTSTKWRVPEDKSRRPDRYTGRKRCTNCNQMGHASYDCPDKRKPKMCSFCGRIGHTADDGGRNCPNALCLNCGVSQSRFQIACEKCLYKTRPIQCNLCGVVGHVDTTCPDLWRRYHSTTAENVSVSEKNSESATTGHDRVSNSNKKTYKPGFVVYCANCGKQGHNYFRCQTLRYKSPCHPHKPFVINDLLPPPTPLAAKPKETNICSPDTSSGTEALNQRKVTPTVDSASSVEMLTIQFDNTPFSVKEFQQNHNPPVAGGSGLQNSTSHELFDFGGNTCDISNVSRSCHDAESQAIITLNAVEHRHLLRAIDENKANDLFNNSTERQVNIEVFKEKCEVHLSGCEDGVDQTRLDIFKLLLRLKAAEIGDKISKKTSYVSVRNEDITEKLNSSVTEPGGRQIPDQPRIGSLNATVASSFPSLNAQLANNIQNQKTTRDPTLMNTSASYQEDELPNMFDIDERVLTVNQRMLPTKTMSRFQPTGPFSHLRPPHRQQPQQRNYYWGNRGDRRYERSYNPPHVSSDRHHGPNNYSRSQRYFH